MSTESPAKNRRKTGEFRPGESGNPNGRPKGTPNKSTTEIKEAARLYGSQAIERLWEIASGNGTDSAIVAACREILDRAYGKAPQGLTLDASLSVRHENALRELE